MIVAQFREPGQIDGEVVRFAAQARITSDYPQLGAIGHQHGR